MEVLGTESRASCLLGSCFTTELSPPTIPLCFYETSQHCLSCKEDRHRKEYLSYSQGYAQWWGTLLRTRNNKTTTFNRKQKLHAKENMLLLKRWVFLRFLRDHTNTQNYWLFSEIKNILTIIIMIPFR